MSKALALMKEAAEENEHVLKNPAPLLSFDSFGENTLTLTLCAYLIHVDYLIQATTDLHTAIMHKFDAASIEIAFPQRDVHIDTLEPLRVHIERTPQQNLKGNDLE